MTLAFQALLLLVLLVCGTVWSVAVSFGQASPRLSSPLRNDLQPPGLWIVENPRGEWFVQGAWKSRADLSKLLQKQGRNQKIHYLPSDALQWQRVARSLRWLRSQAPGAVVLELPPPHPLPR